MLYGLFEINSNKFCVTLHIWLFFLSMKASLSNNSNRKIYYLMQWMDANWLSSVTLWFVVLLLCWPVHLQCLCKLKHIVVVSKQVGDADCEVELQVFLLFLIGLLVSNRKPNLVKLPHFIWLSQKSDMCSVAVLRNLTHDICSHEGEAKVVCML